MKTYKITRRFLQDPEIQSWGVDQEELDAKVGEFICIYSMVGKIEVGNGFAKAYTKKGNFMTSISWSIV